MSARRAMPEGLTAVEELVDEPTPSTAARRALISEPLRAAEPCRRAMPVAEPLVSPVARRALVQLELLAAPDEESAADELGHELVAFEQPGRRPRFGGRMVAAAGLVAVVAPLSGFAVASGAASSAAATPEDTVLVFGDAPRNEQGLPISRDEFRPAIPAAQTDNTVGTLSVAAVDKIIAPGQKAPDSIEQAMAKAASMSGNFGYENMCLSLVASFYGYTSAGEVGAQQAANTIIAAGQMHYDMTDIPVGALVFYDGGPVGNPYGHVAMYAGDGMVYSNGAPTGVGLIPLSEPADDWGEPIIGWSSVWLPTATR